MGEGYKYNYLIKQLYIVFKVKKDNTSENTVLN